MNERYIEFTSGQASLAGIISPADGKVGLLIVVGGPQYRIGSHRQFVKLCRAAAAANIPALRFDVRGMGDSSGIAQPFYQQTADIQAAIEQFFHCQPQLQKIVLWGLCDGASGILLALRAQQDPRIAGVVLVNPWVRQEQSYAQTMVKHYYAKRLLEKEFWQKVFTGKLALTESVRALWQTIRLSVASSVSKEQSHGSAKRSDKQGRAQAGFLPATTADNYVLHMRQGLADFNGHVCVITSGNDLTAQEFLNCCNQDPIWQQQLARAQHHAIADANHTFSTQAWREQVENITCKFITSLQ